MLRVAGSLKMGTVSASELIRSLLRSDKPSTLARAIGDLGRISKTLYLLAYIDDEAYRRRILTQLNRGEGRHSRVLSASARNHRAPGQPAGVSDGAGDLERVSCSLG